MSTVMGEQLGARLVEILGLPANTMWFELRCASNEVVTIKCGYFADIDQGPLVEALADYELHLKAPAGEETQ